MEIDEKNNIKIRLACCIRKILANKKKISLNNKIIGKEDVSLVETIRQLESTSGLSYTIIQQSSVGKRDIQFTSLISLIDAFKISFSEFANEYDKITEKDIEKTIKDIELNKRSNKIGKIKK